MKKITLVALLGATFFYVEISASGAGNLTSNSAHGLTSNEKLFKDKLDSLSNEYSSFSAKINETNERLEGLQSMPEGINSQYARSNSRLDQLEANSESVENNLSLELKSLKAYVEESRKIQDANHKQVKKILTELSSLVDSINSNYVPKNDLNDTNRIKTTSSTIINDSNPASEENASIAVTPQTQQVKIDDSWKKEKHNEILKLTIEDLNENFLESSREKLNYLIEKHYKPARANLWLGEIEYKQQNYNNAIVYYKKSSSISTRGDYFLKLLYHTAISSDKAGDTKSANGLYKALKTNYLNTPEAEASPNRK